MGIAREELYEGGRAYVKERFSGGQAMTTIPVTVLEVMRGAARVRAEKTGREFVTKFAHLEADHEWLEERDRREDEKAERIKREAILPTQPPTPAVRLVPPQRQPLTTSLADLLKNVAVQSAEPNPMPANAAKEQGARVALIREARDLKRTQLASRAACSELDLYSIEGGDRAASPSERKRIADALRVDESVLFDVDAPLPDVTPFRAAVAPQLAPKPQQPQQTEQTAPRRPGRPNPYDEATRTAAVAAYLEGKETIDAIAVRLGIKYSSQVGKWVAQDGHPLRGRDWKARQPKQLSLDSDVPVARVPPMVEPAREPIVAPEISSPPTPEDPDDMAKALAEKRTRRAYSDEFKYKIARQYQRKKMTCAEIQETFGVVPGLVYGWAKLVDQGVLVRPVKPDRAAPPPMQQRHDDEDDNQSEVVELAPAPQSNGHSNGNGAALARAHAPQNQLGRAVVMSDELVRLRAENERLINEVERLKKEAREFLRMIGNRYE